MAKDKGKQISGPTAEEIENLRADPRYGTVVALVDTALNEIIAKRHAERKKPKPAPDEDDTDDTDDTDTAKGGYENFFDKLFGK